MRAMMPATADAPSDRGLGSATWPCRLPRGGRCASSSTPRGSRCWRGDRPAKRGQRVSRAPEGAAAETLRTRAKRAHGNGVGRSRAVHRSSRGGGRNRAAGAGAHFGVGGLGGRGVAAHDGALLRLGPVALVGRPFVRRRLALFQRRVHGHFNSAALVGIPADDAARRLAVLAEALRAAHVGPRERADLRHAPLARLLAPAPRPRGGRAASAAAAARLRAVGEGDGGVEGAVGLRERVHALVLLRRVQVPRRRVVLQAGHTQQRVSSAASGSAERQLMERKRR